MVEIGREYGSRVPDLHGVSNNKSYSGGRAVRANLPCIYGRRKFGTWPVLRVGREWLSGLVGD